MSLFDTLSGGKGSQSTNAVGVSIGIVTNNNDPDNKGRVKLRFPLRNSTDESDWARVATLMAGNGIGMYFLPEVNSEVLVAYEEGDNEHPIVIGALWNGQDKPPENNSNGKNNIRKIKSRAGHEIIMNDDTDSKQAQVAVKSSAGHSIILDDTGGSENITIIDKTGSNKITFDSTQNSIAVEASMKLSIKANVVEIEGTSSLTIKSNAMLTIQGLPVKIN